MQQISKANVEIWPGFSTGCDTIPSGWTWKKWWGSQGLSLGPHVPSGAPLPFAQADSQALSPMQVCASLWHFVMTALVDLYTERYLESLCAGPWGTKGREGL